VNDLELLTGYGNHGKCVSLGFRRMSILWQKRRQAVQAWLSCSPQHGRLPVHSKHEGLSINQKHRQLQLLEESLPLLPEEVQLPSFLLGEEPLKLTTY